MKCHLFSDKVSSMMLYLKAHLPEQTYWCQDMMKMLVYLSDWESVESTGRPVSSLKWYKRGDETLEVMGLEGIENWERFIPELDVVKKAKGFIPFKTKSWDGLEKDEIKILQKVVEIKSSDDYRIGSFSFKNYIFNTSPLKEKPPLRMPLLSPNKVEKPQHQIHSINMVMLDK